MIYRINSTRLAEFPLRFLATFSDLSKPFLDTDQAACLRCLALVSGRQRVLHDVDAFPPGKRRVAGFLGRSVTS
jgi:hypothetical protein